MADPVVLRDLLRDKHWQTYRTFCREYDNAARKIDSSYVGSHPSRAQLHRWQMGDLKGRPHPQHCEVLEAMFPGVRAGEMFVPSQRGSTGADTPDSGERIEAAVHEGLEGSAPTPPAWSETPPSSQASEPAGLPLQLVNKSNAHSPEPLARSLQRLGRTMRLGDDEVAQLALLAGQLIDLELSCTIDIAPDRTAAVSYRFKLLNLTKAPVKRLLREQWFENASGLRIEPGEESDRRVTIQRSHDIGNLVKFACVFSPAIEPGETGTVAYTTYGGRFEHDHFWQQSTQRHTRYLTLTIRHRGVDTLSSCTAVEDQSDGAQVSAVDDLFCTEEQDGALITLTRNYLQPGQSVTVRWEVVRAGS